MLSQACCYIVFSMERNNTNADGTPVDPVVGRPTEAVSNARVARNMHRLAADDEAIDRLAQQWRDEHGDDPIS